MPLSGQERLGKQGPTIASAGGWLLNKAQHDKVPRGLWRVHGKVYDLTKFVPEHPGGADWLQRTKGCDVTDWYETHHIDTAKTDAILKKYFVEDQPNHPPLPYVYSKDNLYGKIKKKVLELSKREKLSESTFSMQLFVAVLLIANLLSIGYLLVENSWTAVLICAFFQYTAVGVGHQYAHRNSWLGTAMDLSLYSKQQWVVTHCLSHHNYTNLEMDLEIIAFEPFVYFLTSQPENPVWALLLQLLLAIASVFLMPLQLLADVVKGIEPFRIQELIMPIQFVLAYWLHGMSGFYMMWVVHALNFIATMMFTFPTHRSKQVWTEGDGNGTRDFAVHILQATLSHNEGISFGRSLLMYQGFTNHVAHHLFPTVDHSKLHLVTPLVLETCREEGLSHLYSTHSFSSIFWGQYPFLFRKKLIHKE